jgi:hypothetical protein
MIANLTFDKILAYSNRSEEKIRDDIKKCADSFKDKDKEFYYWKAAYRANIADNRLRNKEWKNEQIATNRELFYKECST